MNLNTISGSNSFNSISSIDSVKMPESSSDKQTNSDALTNQTYPGANPTYPNMKTSVVTPKLEGSISEEEAFKKAVDKINEAIMGPPRKLVYSVHDHSNTIVVKVVNTETNQVIREVPPEKLLDICDKLVQLAGMIIDEKR